MVFNVKKLLKVGLGLTLRRNSGKNRFQRNERRIYRIYAAEGRFPPAKRENADIYQELFRQDVVPRGRRT